METESVATPTSKDEKAAETSGSGDKEVAEPAEKKEPEPTFQLLSNPARVLPQQVGGTVKPKPFTVDCRSLVKFEFCCLTSLTSPTSVGQNWCILQFTVTQCNLMTKRWVRSFLVSL